MAINAQRRQRLAQLASSSPEQHCPCCELATNHAQDEAEAEAFTVELLTRHGQGEDFTTVLDDLVARRGPDPTELYDGMHCSHCGRLTASQRAALEAEFLAWLELRLQRLDEAGLLGG